MEKRWIVEVKQERCVFTEKADAMALLMAVAKADGIATDYSAKEINLYEDSVDIPGVKCWRGEWLTKAEMDMEEPTENVQIKKLQKELEKAAAERHITNYLKRQAEEKAEKKELEVCRLANILEANQLDKDGKPIPVTQEESDGEA
jgi:hypothetical protein